METTPPLLSLAAVVPADIGIPSTDVKVVKADDGSKVKIFGDEAGLGIEPWSP